MSVHSNRSSVSRRPVGTQMNAATGQSSSPVPSHISRTPSVSSEPILYDTWVGPDIPFRPANPPTSPMAAPNPSSGVEQQPFISDATVLKPQYVENGQATAMQSPCPETNASFAPPDNGSPCEQAPTQEPSIEPNMLHSTLEVVPEAYLNNFWSPEPSVAPSPLENNQTQTELNVSNTGWAIASPQPSPSQPTPESQANLQPRPQSTVSSTISSTGWATATHEPIQQHIMSFQQPPPEDLSPLSLPGKAPSAMPQPLFSQMATPSSASSPMSTPSLSSAQPHRHSSVATNPPSRISSNARPPVLNYNQQRSVESVSFASACCQCSNAIMYNTYYYNCTYCKLDICGTCFQAGQHPWTHLPSMVRLNAKESKAGDRREDRQCENCKAMKHRRMDCDECPYSVCLSCYSNTTVPVHQHKSYQLKATPGLTMSVRRGDGSPCCTKPSFGHCGRCYSPWKPDEWMVQCKTCLFEFEEVVAICLQCDSEILSACRQSNHQMVSMKCREKQRSGPGGQQSNASVECTECAIQFQSMTDISFLRHPHTNYDFLFFTENREQLFAAVYRSCKKKSPRTDTPLAPTANTTKCSYCHHNFPHEALQTCVPCKNVKFCPHCSVIATPTHHHGASNFVSHKDLLQTQLGGGWTQRKNSSGRIWYHHTRTNTHSFDFPQSAIGQAPEPSQSYGSAGPAVPMKPSNPRRATTGGMPSGLGPLPPGWEARKTADGRRYYANHSTKQTSWQRPASTSSSRPAAQPRHGSVPLQNHTGGIPWENQAAAPVVRVTPEQRAAQKALEKKQAERKKLMTSIGTSVLKGVVSGVVKAELR